jgi:hypothetical protein
MPAVRVYQPRKNAMQSGRGKTRYWLVEFEPGAQAQNDSLMGWAGQGDRNGLDYQVIEPKERRIHRKSYSDNFGCDRDKNWTH